MLSEMQERLREEYDRMNCQGKETVLLLGDILSYETLREIELRNNVYDVDVVCEELFAEILD